MFPLLYVTPHFGVGGVETLLKCHIDLLSRDFAVHVLPYKQNGANNFQNEKITVHRAWLSKEINPAWKTIEFCVCIWNNCYSTQINSALSKNRSGRRLEHIFVTHSDVSFFNNVLRRHAQNHTVACVGKKIIKKLATHKFQPKKVVLWPNAVVPMPEQKIMGLGCAENETLRFIFVARLESPKRLDVVIDAMALAIDKHRLKLHLTVVGDGCFANKWKQRAMAKLTTKNVSFLGEKTHAETKKLIACSDVLVHCSVSEGLPMVFLEAMNASTFCIANNVGCIDELIVDGETGFLYQTTELQEEANRVFSNNGCYRALENVCDLHQKIYTDALVSSLLRFDKLTKYERIRIVEKARKACADRYIMLESALRSQNILISSTPHYTENKMYSHQIECEKNTFYEVSVTFRLLKQCKVRFVAAANFEGHYGKKTVNGDQHVLLEPILPIGEHRLYGFLHTETEEKIKFDLESAETTKNAVSNIVFAAEKVAEKLKPGLSLLIRCKNEALTIKSVLRSLRSFVDEIIFVDNGSTDNSLQIAQEVASEHHECPVLVFSYNLSIPRVGDEQQRQVRLCPDSSRNGKCRSPKSCRDDAFGWGNTLAKYYNYVLRRASCQNVMKWDADCLPNAENFMQMIEKHQLRTRSDSFALWCTGETIFYHEKAERYFKKNVSFYDEYRVYSKQCNFRYRDNVSWEGPSHRYHASSKKEVFEAPIFYEIRPITRVLDRPMVDERDRMDHKICKDILNGKVSNFVTEYCGFSPDAAFEGVQNKKKEKKGLYVIPQLVCGGVGTVTFIHLSLLRKHCDVDVLALLPGKDGTYDENVHVWSMMDSNERSVLLQNKDFVIFSAVYEQTIATKMHQSNAKIFYLVHSDICWFNSVVMQKLELGDSILTVNSLTKEKFLAVQCDKIWLEKNKPFQAQIERYTKIKDGVNVHTWPNAIDCGPLFSDEGTTSTTTNLGVQKKVVFVARLDAPKMPLVAIEAISAYSNIHLTVIGNGSYRKDCLACAKKHGIEHNVEFAGNLIYSETMEKIRQSDACLFLSGSEGVPMVLLEAMASNTICITALAGGIGEIAIDNHNAITFDWPEPMCSAYRSTISVSNYDLIVEIADKQHNNCVLKTKEAIDRWLAMSLQEIETMQRTAKSFLSHRFALLKNSIMKTIESV